MQKLHNLKSHLLDRLLSFPQWPTCEVHAVLMMRQVVSGSAFLEVWTQCENAAAPALFYVTSCNKSFGSIIKIKNTFIFLKKKSYLYSNKNYIKKILLVYLNVCFSGSQNNSGLLQRLNWVNLLLNHNCVMNIRVMAFNLGHQLLSW